MQWIRDRGLTLLLMAMFLLFLVGQVVSGFAEYNVEQRLHGQPAVSMNGYLATGHRWEALFENWESEFLQIAVFVLLTTILIQKGSPESRRPGYLRDLAFAQSSQQKMFGYKRAAAAIPSLDVPLTDLVGPDGALPRISGWASCRST